MSERWSLALVLVLAVVAACGTSGELAPSAGPSTTPPSSPPTSTPINGTPSAEPAVNPPPSVPVQTPEPTHDPTLSQEQLSLVLALRTDAQAGCAPRTTDLPAGAQVAIECRPNAAGIDRVGVYRFEAEEDAALTYLERLDAHGALRDGARCVDGHAGDGSWYDHVDGVADPEESQVEYEGRIYSTWRFGCFLNEQGFANVRATCGDGLYVGILALHDDLEELASYAMLDPETGDVTDGFPGICYGQLGGGLDFPDTEPGPGDTP